MAPRILRGSVPPCGIFLSDRDNWRRHSGWHKQEAGGTIMASVNREIYLKSRPSGMPTAANFELVESPVPRPGAGQFLVRNRRERPYAQ